MAIIEEALANLETGEATGHRVSIYDMERKRNILPINIQSDPILDLAWSKKGTKDDLRLATLTRNDITFWNVADLRKAVRVSCVVGE